MPTQKARDELFGHMVDTIPTMQTDIALLKRDIEYITKSSDEHGRKQDEQSKKSDAIIERLDKLNVVTRDEFASYQAAHNRETSEILEKLDVRFKATEAFINDNKPGITLATALVGRWITILVLLIIMAALGTGIYKIFIPH